MSGTPIKLVPREEMRRPYPTGRLLDGEPRAILFDSAKCIGCRLAQARSSVEYPWALAS
jgi:hypothetical protein